GRTAGPRDPGAARRAPPAVRGVLGRVPGGRRAPRQCPEALRGERAAGGTGSGALRADHGRGRSYGPGGTRARRRRFWLRCKSSSREPRDTSGSPSRRRCGARDIASGAWPGARRRRVASRSMRSTPLSVTWLTRTPISRSPATVLPWSTRRSTTQRVGWPRTRASSTRCSRPGAGPSTGKPPLVVGDGRNRVPMVHIDDLADAYVRIAESGLAGEIFNVNDRSRFTLLEMATAAARAAGYQGDVRPTPLPEARKTLGDFADALALSQHIDAGKAVRLLGWQPTHVGFLDEADVCYWAWKAYQE